MEDSGTYPKTWNAFQGGPEYEAVLARINARYLRTPEEKRQAASALERAKLAALNKKIKRDKYGNIKSIQ